MKRRRPSWIVVETMHYDGTPGPSTTGHVSVDWLTVTVSTTVAVITVTDLATHRLVAAVAPLPVHPCQPSIRTRIQLETPGTT